MVADLSCSAASVRRRRALQTLPLVRNPFFFPSTKAGAFAHNFFCLDFGPKKITVNAIAPGGIKTDMYVEAARKYIPGEASMSDAQIDEVFEFVSTTTFICLANTSGRWLPAGPL